MFQPQGARYEPVSMEEGTIPSANPVSNITHEDKAQIQRVNVIPDTIRPPRIVPEDPNQTPSAGRRVAITLIGSTIMLVFLLYDIEIFERYSITHERWVDILAITELIVAITFGLGSIAGFMTGKWESLVPGFVVYKGVFAVNLMVLSWVFLTS